MARNRILLVEDEQTIVDMVKRRLEAHEYEVIVAVDGMEGLDKARKENPNLIILDLMLPKMDGYKVCAMLKRDGRFGHIPIIMFTARAQDTDKKTGEEVGADAYITKPFEAQVLLAKIEELLKKKEKSDSHE